MPPRTYWSNWAETLRRFKLDGIASLLLEAGSPLRLLSAQALYIGQPFMGGNQLEAFAHMLEEDEETLAFIKYLHGEDMQ